MAACLSTFASKAKRRDDPGIDTRDKCHDSGNADANEHPRKTVHVLL